MGHDFSIEYNGAKKIKQLMHSQEGKENQAANALSRKFETTSEEGMMAISSPNPSWLEVVREEQDHNEHIQQIIRRVQDGEAVGRWELRDGLLLFKDRIFLAPESPLCRDIISQFHETTHEGFLKTFHRVRANFYWQKMRDSIKNFVKECSICKEHKVEQLTPAGLLQPLPIPDRIWEDISLDFIEGLPSSQGKTTIFIVVDRLSKYAHFIPIAHPYTVVSIALVFFDNIFKLHGMPKTIVSDRDSTFTSAFWSELFKLH